MTCRRLSSASRQTALGLVCFLLAVGHVGAREFSVRALTDEKGNARNPDISQTGLIAWQAHSPDPDGTVGAVRSDIFVLHPGERDARNITLEDDRINGRCERPIVFDDSVAFLAWFKKDITSTGYPFELSIPPKNEEMKKLEDDYPELFDPPIPTLQPDEEDEQAAAPTNTVDAATLEAEVDANATTNGLAPQRQMWRGSGQAGDLALYRVGNPIERITPGNRHYNSPAGSSAGLAVQVARGWPYGYEMIVWRQGSANIIQLTTNYYYALNANMHEQELVFQAWDGNDYEIFHYRFDTDEIKQITNNQFDDVSPVVWDGTIVWVSYPTITAEIFLYRDGVIRKISEGTEDNANPSIWQDKVVWQGYDDTYLEIYYFDGRRTIKLTSNTWDDMAPQIHDGIITWMSYVDNADAEIMALDLSDNIAVQLTENDYEDTYPKTAGEKIVWQTITFEGSQINMAQPEQPRENPIP